MIRPVPPAVNRFVALVREITGNVIPRARYSFLEELLVRRARATEQPDVTSYVHRLTVGELSAEWQQLIPLITIKESYFFRAPQQFRVLVDVLLPRLLRSRAAKRELRIWSAACARGEEAATLAMVLAESRLLNGWDWRVVATDVDEEALGIAERGIYGERAVSRVPPEFLERYFQRRGKLFEVAAEIKARVQYRYLNLAQAPYALPAEAFDLVFLRNVLIYFQRPLQRRVVTHASKLLTPRGYLFLGASETLWQIYDELHPVDLGVCFCYQHPRPGQPKALPPKPPVAVSGPPPRPPAPKPVVAAPPPPPPPPAAVDPAAGELAAAELDETAPEGREESFVEALSPVPGLSPDTIRERLAEAARELLENRLEEAERVLEGILAANPSDAAAYALEGFLFDLRDRPEDAASSYRGALYLDPSLYQVRLLLADCLLRLGHEDRARHQYREVLAHLGSGRGRELAVLDGLPLPTRARAERRCRQVLRGEGRR